MQTCCVTTRWQQRPSEQRSDTELHTVTRVGDEVGGLKAFILACGQSFIFIFFKEDADVTHLNHSPSCRSRRSLKVLQLAHARAALSLLERVSVRDQLSFNVFICFIFFNVTLVCFHEIKKKKKSYFSSSFAVKSAAFCRLRR